MMAMKRIGLRLIDLEQNNAREQYRIMIRFYIHLLTVYPPQIQNQNPQ